MGKKRPYLTVRVPAIILTCPITTMLFVDHAQFYGSKNAYDPMEYTLIMNLLVHTYTLKRFNYFKPF